MEKIICDQLFINDTSVSKEDLQLLLEKFGLNQCSIISAQELKDVLWYLKPKLEWVDNLLLPWSWAQIFSNVLDIEISIWKPIDVKRKIEMWTMTPRGIEISETSNIVLQNLLWETIIWDDVIASWTTMNWIFKRIWKWVSSFEAISLVLREQNQLNPRIPITAWYSVSKKWWGYPRINTLSSLTDTNKSRLIAETRERQYWEKFVSWIFELFWKNKT